MQMKPISSHFFASLFCWNERFSFKTVTILAGPRRTESQNPWLPTQLQICRPNPAEGWLSLAFLSFFEYKCHCSDHAFIFPLVSIQPPASSSSPRAVCCPETVSRSKIWLYHQISIPAPTCSTCLVLIPQTGAGGLKLPLQWISPAQCFYLPRKHSCTAQPCQCLSVWLSVCLFVLCSYLWSLVVFRFP